MDFLFIVTVNSKSFEGSVEQIDEWAFSDFDCEGRLDYELDEATVDNILGKDAYCGGEIPEEILGKIEESEGEATELRYFWQIEEKSQSFLAFIKEKGIVASLEKQKQEDWNKAWRENFKEIVVSEKMSVVPSWEKVEDSKESIFIYPGMGFGTGNHETTFLCLKVYEGLIESLPEGVECLDFGCGSGILGIAAIKNSKARVDFVDIDADALDNCVMNLEFNEFANYSVDHALVLRERFEGKKTYPLVFANILESVLILEKNLLLSVLDQGSHLIVSGLLKDQRDTIVKEYSSLRCEAVLEKGDWIAIHFIKD